MTQFRDRLACTICNFVLNHLASAQYRKMIDGSIRYGLSAAIRDSKEDTHG